MNGQKNTKIIFVTAICALAAIAAALLLLCSFLTRYALYYRMLAGLCATIASARFLLERSAHTPPPS